MSEKTTNVYEWTLFLEGYVKYRAHLCYSAGDCYFTVLAAPPTFPCINPALSWVNHGKKFNRRGCDYETCS